MTYPELAPIISGTGITRTAVETYFSNLPEPPPPPEPPAITKAKVQTIANKYFEDGKMNFEKHNGVLSVAQEVGLTADQVKAIVREIEVLYQVWQEINSPE